MPECWRLAISVCHHELAGHSQSPKCCTSTLWLAWVPVPKCLCQKVSLPAPEPTCGSPKPNSSAVAQVPPSSPPTAHTTAQRQVPPPSLQAPIATMRSTPHTPTSPLPAGTHGVFCNCWACLVCNGLAWSFVGQLSQLCVPFTSYAGRLVPTCTKCDCTHLARTQCCINLVN